MTYSQGGFTLFDCRAPCQVRHAFLQRLERRLVECQAFVVQTIVLYCNLILLDMFNEWDLCNLAIVEVFSCL